MPCAMAACSFAVYVAASQISKWLPMPSSITSRSRVAARRSSGVMRTRPAVSSSTSAALPRKIRFHQWASIGSAAMRSRKRSHSGRGNSMRQPSGCLVTVTRPSACS